MIQHGSKDARPTVTVGMPVYNGAHYVREALDSVLAQTYGDFELIVSDNASEDETQSICEGYCRRDSRIQYVRQERNIGMVPNFAFLADQAKGEFFNWLAHDDGFLPLYLEMMIDYLRNNPRTVVVASDLALVDEHGRHLGVEALATIRGTIDWDLRRGELFSYPMHNAYHAFYGLMRTDACRRAVQQSWPKWDRNPGCDDIFMCCMAIEGEVSSIPVVLRHYRVHAQSEYAAERERSARQSPLGRFLARTEMRNKMRYTQIRILFSSRLPRRLKYSIFLKAVSRYAMFFLREASTLLSRAVKALRWVESAGTGSPATRRAFGSWSSRETGKRG